MNFKYIVRIGIIGIVSGLILIVSFTLSEKIVLLVIGIFLLVVSVIFTLLISSLKVFSEDKSLDIEELRKQGLTIIECSSCKKINVKEDIYCVYCGEKLPE